MQLKKWYMNINHHLYNGSLLILIINVVGIFNSCKTEVEVENIVPEIEITSPQNGEIIEFGDTVTISANASDPDGTIRDVQFYINGVKDSVFDSPPYEYNWFTIEEETGSYEITAFAIDNNNDDGLDRVTISLSDLGTVNDYDGNTYNWTRIGEQRWMIENLKSTHYSDGTEIPLVESVYGWVNLNESDKGFCYFENSVSNNEVYGALYNWPAAMNGQGSNDSTQIQGVCPTGWHLPNDAEWKELEVFLGMDQDHADEIGWRGFNEGGKLKEVGTDHWESPNTGATNIWGFTALPGGYRIYYGAFNELGFGSYFWSASEFNSSQSWKRYLHSDNKTIGRKMELKNSGFSVRCVED